MNPCEHPDWPTGNQRPVSRRYALRVFRVTPGSTVTSKSSGWRSRTCSMFLKLKHTPPWRMMTQTNTGNKTYDSYHQDDILLVIVVTKDVNCSKWEKVWPHKYLTFIAPTPPSKPVPVPKGMMGRQCLWQTFAKALTSSTQRGNTTTSGGRHLHKNNAMLSHSVFSTSPKNHTHSSHCSQQLSQKPQLTTHVFASGCVSL